MADGSRPVWCEAKGVSMGKAAQPPRIAVTGGTVSPGLGQTPELVGKAGVLERMELCPATHRVGSGS